VHLKIAVINKSTVVPQADMQPAVAALAIQARHHVAVEWALRLPEVALFTEDPGPPWWPLVVVDEEPDVPGALGFHDENESRPYGRDFAKTCQKYGVSWQSCAGHEIPEMMGDAHVQAWSNDDYGNLWATELCDPVESNIYEINGVEVSDFVLPSWFDPQGKPPYSFMDKHKMANAPGLTRPFEVAHGGYAIYSASWPKVTQVFSDGEDQPTPANGYPEWRMWELKLTAGSRSLDRYPTIVSA